MSVDVRTDSRGLRGPGDRRQGGRRYRPHRLRRRSDHHGLGRRREGDVRASGHRGLVKAGRKVDGFNLGVGNYNTLQELTLFREVGAPLKPDIIVLAYFINDAEPMPSYVRQRLADRPFGGLGGGGLSVRQLLFRLFGEAPDWKRYYRDLYEPKAAGWLQTRRRSAASPRRPATSAPGSSSSTSPSCASSKPYPFADITAKVRAVVEKDGVPFVDLLPTVENLDPASAVGDGARSASQRQSRDHLRPRHDPATRADAGRALPHQGQRLLTTP